MGDSFSIQIPEVDATSVSHSPTAETEAQSIWIADFGVNATILHKSIRIESFGIRVFLGVAEDMPSTQQQKSGGQATR